eukprot:gene63870-87349_t
MASPWRDSGVDSASPGMATGASPSSPAAMCTRAVCSDIGQLGAPQTYFRTHALLVTGDGTPALKWGSTNAYTEDAQGRPIYDWTIVDRIFDAYLAHGVKPYAQIGFMPQALSTKPEPYQHEWRPGFPYNDIYTGWAYPPKDYTKWAELVYQWVKHCVARYGAKEVESWYWEVWNEPNIGYWNLFCLGQALLPLIGEQDAALAALEPYKAIFPAALEAKMLAKL